MSIINFFISYSLMWYVLNLKKKERKKGNNGPKLPKSGKMYAIQIQEAI